MKNMDIRQITTEQVPEIKESAALFGIKDEDKIEKFESLLFEGLKLYDSVSDAVQKMVKAALTVEFGESILLNSKAQNMIRAISQSIVSDNELRRQSLIIMDRFAKADELNA